MWMDLDFIILSEVSQKEKDITYHLYMESKIWQKWTYLQNRNRLTDTENRLVFPVEGGESERGMDSEFEVSRWNYYI